ncbi:unnamed protein product, partial [Polarella glacialis]
LVDRGWSSGLEPSAEASCRSRVLAALAEEGLWRDALALLQAPAGGGCRQSPMSGTWSSRGQVQHSSVIAACARMPREAWPWALHLLGQLSGSRVAPDELTLGSAVSCVAGGFQWAWASRLLSQARAVWGLEPGVVAFTACQRGEWGQSLGLLAEMRQRELLPNAVSFSSALSACQRERRWENALGLASSAFAAAGSAAPSVSERSSPSKKGSPTAVFTALASVYEAGRQWEAALQLLAEVQALGRCGLELEASTANAVLSACGESLRWGWALLLLQRQPQLGLVPEAASYGAATRACCHGSQWSLSLSLLSSMRQARLEDNLVACAAATASCEVCGTSGALPALLCEASEGALRGIRALQGCCWWSMGQARQLHAHVLAGDANLSPKRMHTCKLTSTALLKRETSRERPIER